GRLRAEHGHGRAQQRAAARPAAGGGGAHGVAVPRAVPRPGRSPWPHRAGTGRRPGAARRRAAGACDLGRRRHGAPRRLNAKAPRHASVDALRGLTVAAMLLVNNPGDWGHVYAPLRHADWHGCTPTDLVFPFFLFVVGVSIALGLVPRMERGDDLRALWRSILARGLRIVGLGLLLHLAAWWAFDAAHYRIPGVLQRIGLCFLVAAPLALHLRPRAQWMLIAALLLGWWLLLAAGGSYERYLNLADRIDTALLAPWLYDFDAVTGRGHDPEGLPATLPAIATVLLG